MGCSGSSSKPKPGGSHQESSKEDSSKTEAEQDKADKKDGDRNRVRRNSGDFKRGGFIIDNPGKITDSYLLEKKKLGEGSYGSVCKGTNQATKAVRAIKTIPKAQMKNLEKFKMEIQIMKMMDHPNIIKLYENFEDHRNIYLVMELCKGGELFDRIIDLGHFTEVQAATVMQDIVRAIFHMHEMHVCHRDLKPENFLFLTKEVIEKNTLKIIDFGLSCPFSEGQVLSTKAGTPYYVAPQVLAGNYDHTSDLWSCGVISYVLLCGYPPFYGENDKEVLAKVKQGNFSFNPSEWKHISEDAKDLIRHLLKMNPKDRYTAEQALNHVWIKNKAPKATEFAITNLIDNLRGFRSLNRLKKAALHVIALQLDEPSIANLKNVFMALDENGDGCLTNTEMKEGLHRIGLKEIPPDLQQIMEEVDSDGSGVIDYTEFLAATLDKRAYIQEDVVWSAFRVFDRNGDGVISKQELQEVLGSGDVADVVGVENIAEMMSDVDTNGDGNIDFQEFLAMMRGQITPGNSPVRTPGKDPKRFIKESKNRL